MKKRFSNAQIVSNLREAELGTKTVEQLAREHGFSQNSSYVSKRKFGAMSEPDMKWVREKKRTPGSSGRRPLRPSNDTVGRISS